MTFAQLLEQSSRKTELGQRVAEIVFVLEFLALLRGHVGFEKDLARILRLRAQRRREKDRKTGQQNDADFFHQNNEPDDSRHVSSCNPHLHHK